MKTLMNKILSRRMLLVLSLLAAGFFCFVIYRLQVVPFKFFVPLVLILLIIVLLFYRAERDKRHEHPIRVALVKLVNILVCIGLVFLSLKVMEGSSLISSITGVLNQTIEMDIVVLKSSNYSSLEDLTDLPFGSNSKDAINVNKTETLIEDEIGDIDVMGYDGNNAAIDALMNNEVKALIVKSIDLETFNIIQKDFSKNVEVLKRYEIKIPNVKANAAEVTKEPFHVFISGRDKKGDISTFSLSDVNMIATINPKTKQILLTNIPRDYFVDMIGINGVVGKDKLTHSAKGGTEATIATVENLMGIEMNYYAKFNFTSFMNVIDALGGIEIDVPHYEVVGRSDGVFTTRLDHIRIEPGLQEFNAKEALSFVRERYAFVDGDDIRGKNQMLMLKAIVKKCCTPAVLNNLGDVVESLSSSFETNLSSNDITSLINMQISDMSSWDIQSYRLYGDASYRTLELATVGNVSGVNPQGLYVTVPSEDSVAEAKGYISQIMNDEIVKVEDGTSQENNVNNSLNGSNNLMSE